ncbi:MAG: MBL fold metallo-hydrolase, partial [Actinomycetota bacterium]
MARSFDSDPKNTVMLAAGQRAHRDHVAQSDVIARRFESPTDGVWSLVGNGLSNQTFVKVPDGIIAIDTGESVEEMREALHELRKVERAPIVAVIYTHFHYIDGTAAITEESGNANPLPIIGHERIAANRARATAEIG